MVRRDTRTLARAERVRKSVTIKPAPSKPIPNRKRKPNGKRAEKAPASTSILRVTNVHQAIQTEILRAAARCFALSGLDATTMRDIAKAAGYTVSSLYGYFSSKESLVLGLVDYVTQKGLTVFEEPLPTSLTTGKHISIEVKLSFVLERMLRLVEEERDVFIFMTKSQAHCKACSHEKSNEPACVASFASWFHRHSTKAERGRHTERDLAYLVWGLFHGAFLQWLFEGSQTGGLIQKHSMIMSMAMRGIGTSSR